MRRGPALAVVVVSSACYATLAVLTTLAYREGMQPLPMLAWRFGLVAVLMLGMQLLRDRRALLVGPKVMGRFAVLAFAGYGMGSICFFFALKQTSASVVAVLLYAYPALVSLIEHTAGQRRLDRFRAGALAATFAGCVLVLQPFGAERVSTLGMLLGFGAAIGYAFFSFLSHRWMGVHPRSVLMTYVFAVSSALAAAAALATGASLSPMGWGASAWALLGTIALVPTFLAVVLYLQGVRWLGPSQAAIVSTFEPLFTISLAAVVLGEKMQPVQWAGALMVVGGVLIGEIGERTPIEPAPV